MAGNGFNAFDYAAELKKAGVPDHQAELQARALAQLQDSTSATKQDLELTKLELKRDIEAVRAELKHDIEGVRAELKHDIEGVRAELKHDIEGVRAELKGDIKQLEIGLKKYIGDQNLKMLGMVAALLAIFRFLPSFFN